MRPEVIKMVYIFGRKKEEIEKENSAENSEKKGILYTPISRREMMKIGGAALIGTYLAACKSPESPYDADKDKPPEQPKRYNLSVKLYGLGNGNPITSFKAKASGPETKEAEASNGYVTFENLLEGPYELTLFGDFYGGKNTDGTRFATRYTKLDSHQTYESDVVEEGWVDFEFLEQITRMKTWVGNEEPIQRWTYTPEYVIVKTVKYKKDGTEYFYEFTDNYIEQVLKDIIQNDVPDMHQGNLFKMGVPRISFEPEYLNDPFYANLVLDKFLTFPYNHAKGVSEKDGNKRKGIWLVWTDGTRSTNCHELLHGFEFGDVHYEGAGSTIMFFTESGLGNVEQPTLIDKKAGKYWCSRENGTKRFDVEPKPEGFNAMLQRYLEYYSQFGEAGTQSKSTITVPGNYERTVPKEYLGRIPEQEEAGKPLPKKKHEIK